MEGGIRGRECTEGKGGYDLKSLGTATIEDFLESHTVYNYLGSSLNSKGFLHTISEEAFCRHYEELKAFKH